MTASRERVRRTAPTGLAWTETGSGDATLLVHAGLFAGWFEPLADLLPGQVVRVERAGYGGPLPGPVGVTGHAAHLAALLDDLGTGPVTVVGHSSGSVIALQLALDRPDLVGALVLGEPPLIDGLLDPADLAPVHGHMGPHLGRAMTAVAAGDLPTAVAAFLTAIGSSSEALAAMIGPDGLARAERDCESFFTDEVPSMGGWTLGAADAARITVPVLLVVGAASPQATHRLAGRLRAMLPAADVAEIPGADHMLPLTHPADLARQVTTARRNPSLS